MLLELTILQVTIMLDWLDQELDGDLSTTNRNAKEDLREALRKLIK